ncbi:MAG: response regulator [Actinobacteria bacterium]|nr:response regulator [Actinomycetota bacterium]
MAAPKILVVEDDPVILDLLVMSFELEGWTVVRASDGAEGLAVARAERPDAVVTDVMMPVHSGLDLLADLRGDADLASIPVVVLSARALDRDVEAGFAAGADDYVTKPFEPDDLLERVEKLLGRRP